MSKNLQNTQSEFKKLFPGPGYYDPKVNSRNTGIKISQYNTIDVLSNTTINITPGPGNYHNDKSSEMISISGGTGKHNGYKISFTKD